MNYRNRRETERPETPGEAWTSLMMASTRDPNQSAGTARTSAWLGAVEQQLDGVYDPAAAQATRDRARAQGDPDPVSGEKASRWLRTMAGRMTPTENPPPVGPPQPNPTWDALRARQVEEQRARAAEEQRSRAGWLGSVEASAQREFDRVAAHVAARDQVAAERATDRSWAEREAARDARRAAAEESRRELLAGVAAEVQAELAAEARRERRLARQRAIDDARGGEGEEFGGGWGGDAA